MNPSLMNQGPATKSDREFTIAQQRRFDLIQKKYRSYLTDEEVVELAGLQAIVSEYVMKKYPLPPLPDFPDDR